LRRSVGPNGATVEQRWYAHRSSARKGLLIMELSSLNGTAEGVELRGGLTPSDVDTTDIDFSMRHHSIVLPASNSTSNATILCGKTREPETNATRRTTVCVVATVPPSGAFALTGRVNFIASFATSLESEEPEAAAIAAYADAMAVAPSTLWDAHVAEWELLWDAGIELEGRHDAASAINASFYYLLSSIRSDVVHSLSPGGLPSNGALRRPTTLPLAPHADVASARCACAGYHGHTFWDCETWMLPPLLILHPTIAASLLEYRTQRIAEARLKAKCEAHAVV
jgi:trehalose/maltose hydrolase-like predicted phosphorylase